jgi:tetratricopeptide (TPR) repeat protein
VWIFQGVAAHARGEEDAARKYFTCAAINPEFSRDAADAMLAVAALDAGELKTFRAKLAEREDKIYESWAPEAITFPRDEYSFAGDYLIAKGVEALRADETDYAGAMACFESAIRVDPANADAFAAAALAAFGAGDVAVTARYIDEGLYVEPEHEGLLKLLEGYNGDGGQ